jgi:hypothetical protein
MEREMTDATDTRAVVERLEQLKVRARGDRRATSAPLLTFGAITLLGAPLGVEWGWGWLYWLLAAPVGFGFLAWRQRWRAARTGVGGGHEPYVWLVLGWGAALVLLGLLATLAPLMAITIGLLVVARWQDNRYLAVCAVLFGVIGTLEVPFYGISNRLYDVADAVGLFKAKSGYFSWSQQLVIGLLAAFLLAAGLVALRREARAACSAA